VLFADLTNFTPLAQLLDPAEVIALLNDLFRTFDRIAGELGVEKIKTIGDAYMAVAGVPERRTDHAEALAAMALRMHEAAGELSRKHARDLNLRIGIATGTVMAGVIGTTKFAYDIWGDTVNTAARLESHGLPGRIQVTTPFRNGLADRFRFEHRGIVDLKGKGPTETWFLVARSEAVQPH
jgi:adenylate cyclase